MNLVILAVKMHIIDLNGNNILQVSTVQITVQDIASRMQDANQYNPIGTISFLPPLISPFLPCCILYKGSSCSCLSYTDPFVCTSASLEKATPNRRGSASANFVVQCVLRIAFDEETGIIEMNRNRNVKQ
jgi:hypothetical protein